MKKASKKNVQLPQEFKPERYVLTLEPTVEEARFTGSEILHYTLKRPVKKITLHALDLKVTNVSVVAGGKTIKPKHISYNKKSETVTFTFGKTIPKGKGRLYLTFKGALNDRMHGFYRARYVHKGRERFLATTQFEATDARRAFPCVDEPAAKATFEVTIIAPEERSVISNTVEKAIVKHEYKDGYKAVTFTPTPKMSTYLLAFIVGDFEYIEGKTKEGVLVRVFVTPGKKEQAKFALETAKKCLEYYNHYFGIPYPLPVLDLIAIPDFAAGAMENWGAVTYRESVLLFDEKHSSLSDKQRIAIVVAHELAHQWFGNLVTMEWWTDLWLNEGFASYMEYKAIDEVFPEWDIWTQFVSIDMSGALNLDAYYNTHPIEVPVHHPAEIDEIFDAVSYSKGACVIRMLANYLGEKDFREGLRRYLKKHAHKNATTQDLWDALEAVSGKPVHTFMKKWTKKEGYPLIKVHRTEKELAFEQSRFFMSPLSKEHTADTTRWTVPLAVTLEKGETHSKSFSTKKETLPGGQEGWVQVNPNQTGFYRVDYSPSLLTELRSAVEKKELSTADRLALVRDIFALAEAGESTSTDALSFLTSYTNETKYAVWSEIASRLSSMKKILYGTKAYPQFEMYCQKLFAPTARRVGWAVKQNESHTNRLLRGLLFNQLVAYNHTPTIERAQKLFERKHIPPDMRTVAYSAVARKGGAREHNVFTKMYKETASQQEQTRIARALAAFEKPELLERTLEFAFSKHVRPQDTFIPVNAVWANPRGQKLAWRSLKKNWNELVQRYTINNKILGYFIKPTSFFVTEKDAHAVEVFFKKTDLPKTNRSLAQSLEKIHANAAWKKRDQKALESWLHEEIGE